MVVIADQDPVIELQIQDEMIVLEAKKKKKRIIKKKTTAHHRLITEIEVNLRVLVAVEVVGVVGVGVDHLDQDQSQLVHQDHLILLKIFNYFEINF
jgi:hypothetical protein